MSELALQLIIENKLSKNPFLDLRNCGLEYELPKELFECVWLKDLSLGTSFFDNFKEWIPSNNKGKRNVLNGYELINLQKLPLLRNLHLSNNKIQDISFLQDLTNLEVLSLSGNPIENYSFLQNLTQLHTLKLNGNQIQDISFLKNLTQLKYLDLSSNQIQDNSFLQNLTQLHTLYYISGQSNDVSFLQNLTQLKILDLSFNEIQNYHFIQNLTQLQALYLRLNFIQDISFLQNLTQLHTLDIISNNINNISPIKHLTQLQNLYISGNNIQDYSFLQNLTQLQNLDLSNSQIQDIDFLTNFYHLHTLNLSNNQIQDVSFLQNLTQLQSLDLQNNQIKDIEFLQNFYQLNTLNLSNNQIQDYSLLQNLKQLNSLDLRNNNIQSISFLKNLTQLQSLDLSYNQILDYSFLKNLTQLNTLNLIDNEIQEISFLQNLTQLQSLNLSENPIQDISFLQNLTKINSLHLGSHQIKDYSFLKNLTQLEYLYLSFNLIEDYSFLQNLTQLHTLCLSENQIQDISFLQNLTQLQSLELNYNEIQDIRFLKNFTQLHSLSLTSNQIQDVTQIANIIKNSSLINIDLEWNPLPIPHEINKANLNELRAFFNDLEKGLTIKRFSKLLFLGDGCVGKTTLYQHLKYAIPPSGISVKDRTHGIALDIWEKDLENLKVNVWDFGGQEIFHGTHRLFLGQRALYILVWTKQKNKLCSQQEQHPLKYWLDFIADYGNESTVLLVENIINGEFDEVNFPDEKTLKQLIDEFASKKIQLKPTHYRIDCQNNTRDVKIFKAILKEELENLLNDYPIIEFPENWMTVIDELEKLKIHNKTISMIEYSKICQQHKISDTYSFLIYLDRVGTVSYFQDLYKDIIILQTDWVLNALYEAIRITDNPLKITKGKLSNNDFNNIWQSYNDEEKQLFKSYMLNSELLAEPPYFYGYSGRLKRPYQYLIPNLFPPIPSFFSDIWKDKIQYWVIKFKFIYPALMQRLQVRILNFCHFEEEEMFYKNYLAFTSNQNQNGHIQVLEDVKEMRIWTDAPDFYIEIINLINDIYPLERVNVFERVKEKEDMEIEFYMNENKKKYQLKEH